MSISLAIIVKKRAKTEIKYPEEPYAEGPTLDKTLFFYKIKPDILRLQSKPDSRTGGYSMKVLLVVTPSSPQSLGADQYFLHEPLALEYVGAGIQKDHEVKLLDLRVEKNLLETLESFKPDIVGCSGYTIDVLSIKQLCSEVKERYPEILTVVGGHHATGRPVDFFDGNIDVIVKGEGSHAFRKLCDRHQKRQGFADIENIYYKKNGQMVFTRQAEHPPLDSLPLPARDLTSRYRDHYKFLLISGPTSVALIRGSTGCPHRCKFCSISTVLNRKMYTRRIDKIIEELSGLKESYVFWVDDEFLINPKRALAIASEIDKAGIKKHYWFYGRSDNIVRHPECIEEWAKIGLQFVMVGLESHRERDLKEMHKDNPLKMNKEAVRICRENGVQMKGNFIINPDFGKRDFKKLVKYIRKLAVDIPTLSVLTPFPGTELFEEVKENLITKNFNLFDVYHAVLPTKLPLKQFYEELGRATARLVPLKKRVKVLKEMDAQTRQLMAINSSKFMEKLLNAYRDYN